MYGGLVADSETCSTIGGWYHGGINIRESSVGHPKYVACRLKGGSLGGSPMGESPCCIPSSG